MDSPAPPPPGEAHTASRQLGWRLRSRTLQFGPLPALMGIVNVTPDSFSDGGRFFDPTAAIDQGLRLVEHGAEILDVGGESTRPGAAAIDESEELRRVLPVVAALSARASVPVSIDTSKARVAAEAIPAGAEIINDVTGLEGDEAMLDIARGSGAGVCAMRMQGTPRTMQIDPRYEDVVRDVAEYLRRRRDALQSAGIAADRVCLDPGIGFGKTHAHNLTLLTQIASFHALGCPLLVGPSRKGFIAKVSGDATPDRVPGTIGVCLALARRGVQILRVHDVQPLRQALLLFAASGGLEA